MGCTSKVRAKDGSPVSGYCTHYRENHPCHPPRAPPAFWLDRDISIYFPSTSTLTSHNCFIHRRTTRTVRGPLLTHSLRTCWSRFRRVRIISTLFTWRRVPRPIADRPSSNYRSREEPSSKRPSTILYRPYDCRIVAPDLLSCLAQSFKKFHISPDSQVPFATFKHGSPV